MSVLKSVLQCLPLPSSFHLIFLVAGNVTSLNTTFHPFSRTHCASYWGVSAFGWLKSFFNTGERGLYRNFKKWPCHFLYFKCCKVYLFIREADISYLLVHSLNAYNLRLGQAEAISPELTLGLSPGGKDSSWHWCFARAASVRSWNWQWNWDLNSDTLMLDAGIPSSILSLK